jgi:hypothetical protein
MSQVFSRQGYQDACNGFAEIGPEMAKRHPSTDELRQLRPQRSGSEHLSRARNAGTMIAPRLPTFADSIISHRASAILGLEFRHLSMSHIAAMAAMQAMARAS